MDINIWLPKLSMILGILCIVLLSCDDFRKHVRKFISRWRYYVAISIFVVINLFVYLVLTYAVIQQSPDIIYKNTPIDGGFLNMLMPLILAFFYFGAGAGRFRLWNRDIQLTKRLRDILEGMFNAKPLGQEDVHSPEKETVQYYATLRKEAKKIEVVAGNRNWEQLLAQWSEFKEDERVLKEHLRYLKQIKDDLAEIRTDLGDYAVANRKLARVVENIQDRVRFILKTLITKVHRILVAYAFKYHTDEAELTRYLVDLEMLEPGKMVIDNNPSVVNRGLILGFMFGLLFGPLFGIIKGADVIYYCWRGSIVLMLFAGCVSYGVQSRRWKKAVLVSGIGGYLANFLWCVLDKQNLDVITRFSFEWLNSKALYCNPIVGLSYGIVTALMLFALKFNLAPRLPSKRILYAVTILFGATVYPLLHVLIRTDFTLVSTLLSSGIGAIAMSSLALAVRITETVDKPGRLSSSEPTTPANIGCRDPRMAV